MKTLPLIDPDNMPMWTVAGFVLALLALVMALIGLYRTNMVIVATQAEVLALAQRIEGVRQTLPPVAMHAPAAPAAPATK